MTTVLHDVDVLNNGRVKLNKQLFASVSGKRIIAVPQGFTSDLASIPRIFWRILPPWDGKTVRASVVHDYLYSGGYLLDEQTQRWRKVSRKEADEIMRDIMMQDKAPEWKVSLIYHGLRFANSIGWVALRLYLKHRKAVKLTRGN